jgi:hypothetical protein
MVVANRMNRSVDVRPAEALRRYARPVESPNEGFGISSEFRVPFARTTSAIADCQLSEGSRDLLRGLLRTGRTRVFPGGGIGIEYGSLLKTAVRPEYLAGHVREAVAHLRENEVDFLIVPGMSGYPVGAVYAIAAELPAVLLKKQKSCADPDALYPAGSFVIPSYTGDGDVVISADHDAVVDILAVVLERRLKGQPDEPRPFVAIRAAGADDIIDKATMAHAITESAPLFCQAALDDAVARYRSESGDEREIEARVDVVSWVTPLIKAYNAPDDHLRHHFGITPFAGVWVTSVHLDPCAIGVEGAGVLAFAEIERL